MPLETDDVVALVRLARYMIRADGRVTQVEVAGMKQLARDVGLVAFSDALEKTKGLPAIDGPELLRLARSIKGEEKHIEAFRYLAQLAVADGLAEPERRVLNALAAEWGLEWETD